MKKFIQLILVTSLTMATVVACGVVKYTPTQISTCTTGYSSTQNVPYQSINPDDCVITLSPFDLSLWNQAPLNSYKSRGAKTAELGCQPLTAAADNCDTCGPLGHSTTLLMNFDPLVLDRASKIQRAVVAVYSPQQAQGLQGANFRGRLNIGQALTSLARERIVRPDPNNSGGGWVLFEVTSFVARAINEQRNSIHFEISFPCQTPANNLVTVGVNYQEPKLLLEFN